MSSTELNITLQMCGLEDVEESLLPMWFTTIAEKGITDDTRNAIITKQLNEVIFDNVEITIMAPLLQMIWKRKWLANHPRTTFKTASQRLSMFTVAQSSEDEVVTINECVKALEQATSTTPKEIKDVTKIPAKVPVDSHEFVELLKTFYKSFIIFVLGWLLLIYPSTHHL